MSQFLRNHPLVWIVPLLVVPTVLIVLAYLANAESMAPDDAFIYGL